jgi:hypothetical protein
MSIGALRKIPMDKRQTKINDKGRICRGASGASLIQVDIYLMPLEWNEKIIHIVTVFQNLNIPLIIRINAIHQMSITYLCAFQSFMFQEDIIGEKIQKNLLKVQTNHNPRMIM